MLMLEERANGEDCAGGIQPVCQPLCREGKKEGGLSPCLQCGQPVLVPRETITGGKMLSEKTLLVLFVPSTFLRGPRTHFWQKLFQGRWREKTIKRGSTRQIRFASSLVQSWHQEQKKFSWKAEHTIAAWQRTCPVSLVNWNLAQTLEMLKSNSRVWNWNPHAYFKVSVHCVIRITSLQFQCCICLCTQPGCPSAVSCGPS